MRSLDGTPVTLSQIYLDAVRFPQLDEYDFAKESLYGVLRERYGVEVKSGHENLSISNCDEREAECLMVKVGSPVLYQSGITADDQDKVFECFKEITLAQYICLASELTRKQPVS